MTTRYEVHAKSSNAVGFQCVYADTCIVTALCAFEWRKKYWDVAVIEKRNGQCAIIARHDMAIESKQSPAIAA